MANPTFFAHMPSVFAAASLSVVIFFLAGCAEREGADQRADTLDVDTATVTLDTAGVSEESIYDLMRGDERFSTFVTAIDSANLDQTLSGPGPFTVFAPVNQAFTRMDADLQGLLREENEDELRDLLLSHISNGEWMAAVLPGQTVRTLAGGDLNLSESGDSLRVGDARIIEKDIDAANGVVHAVGRVLAPSMEDEGL